MADGSTDAGEILESKFKAHQHQILLLEIFTQLKVLLQYICQISIPNEDLCISSKISRECHNNTSKVYTH